MNESAPANGYSAARLDGPLPLTSAAISRLFTKAPGWFDRDRVRKRLYSKGFPHPFERGLWSAQAVADWMATAGSNPDCSTPTARRRRPVRRQRLNGYAPVGEPH
jgi:hypothetical protein